MRKILLITAVFALVAPTSALAHGDLATPDDTTMNPGWDLPTISEVEDAIDAAAAEFAVPVSILEAVAHTESRWQHRPYRVSQDGRRGLFQIPATRQELAAELLKRRSQDLGAASAREVFALLAGAVPAYQGLSYKTIGPTGQPVAMAQAEVR